jgi:hypothetical protein
MSDDNDNDDISLIFGDEPKATASFPVHRIVVTKARPDPDFDDGQELEFTIEHGECTQEDEACIVESTVRELGLRSALFGIWGEEVRPRVEVKTYKVRGWVSKYDIPGAPIEYDAGIEEVDDADDE